MPSELYAVIWTHDITSVKQDYCPLYIQIYLALHKSSSLVMSEIVINVCQYLQCGVTWPVTCDIIAPSWWFIVSFVIYFPVYGRHDALFLPRICPIVVDIKWKILFSKKFPLHDCSYIEWVFVLRLVFCHSPYCSFKTNKSSWNPVKWTFHLGRPISLLCLSLYS
jgi:hypothetical protein